MDLIKFKEISIEYVICFGCLITLDEAIIFFKDIDPVYRTCKLASNILLGAFKIG